jgi:hypothetical protein
MPADYRSLYFNWLQDEEGSRTELHASSWSDEPQYRFFQA